MNDLKVLLIFPPFYRLFGEKKKWYPLSILHLATYLRSKNIEAFCYNADFDAGPEKILTYRERYTLSDNFLINLDHSYYVWDEIGEVLKNYKPDVIGISVLTEALGSATRVAEIARQKCPEATIVAGGPHVSIDASLLLKSKLFDFAIYGEGELPLVSLINCLTFGEDYRSVKGLCYLNDSVVIKSLPGDTIVDLNEIGFPDPKYFVEQNLPDRIINKFMISIGRGCPYACGFCHCSKWNFTLRTGSAGNIISIIEKYTEQYGINKLLFVDDTFTWNKKFVKEFCETLISKRIEIKWSCSTHVNDLNHELLTLMKQAGCESIHVGVESGSQRVLDFMNKRVKIESIFRAGQIIKNAGIEFRTYFLVGIPTETEDDIAMSMEFMRILNPDEAMLHVYVPVPGTPMYNYIKENIIDIEKSIDWTIFSRHKLDSSTITQIDHVILDAIIDNFYTIVETINRHA